MRDLAVALQKLGEAFLELSRTVQAFAEIMGEDV